MADDKETKLRPKKSFQFKLPKIRFGSELHVPDISAPMGVKPIVSIVVDKDTGTLDLNSVPAEFQELVQKLYENISKPKTMMKIEEKAEDEVVKIRKGPCVQKGLKEEEILKEMKSLVKSEDPWNIYDIVNDVRIGSQFSYCFDHRQALLYQTHNRNVIIEGIFRKCN